MKPGVAFSDHIITEKIKRGSSKFFDRSSGVRRLFVPIVLIASLIILIFRLLYLQIVEGSYYRSLSDENRTRTSTIYASRGVIFDRNGKALVFNVPGFREIVNGKTRVLDNTEALSLIAAGKENLEIDSLRSYPYKDVFAHVLGYIGQISEEELKKKEFSE